MTTSLPGALILKEGRALAFIWLGAAVTMVAAAKSGEPLLALFAFVLGAAALGVFSIGHEYAHRTLTMLLAQPLTRSRLLLSKVVVLASLLVLLSIIAAVVLLRPDGIERVFGEGTIGARWRLAVVVLTPLLGLCVAPWLTMVCRSAMGGLVFTLAVPAGLWIAGQIARAVTTNFDAARNQYAVVDRLQLVMDRLEYEPALTLMIVGVLAISIVAAVSGRSMFVQLEALDAPGDIAPSARKITTRVVAHAQSQRRHPAVMLAQKEVRLHALAFAVAALYALGWIVMRLTRTDTLIAGQSFESVSALYGMFVAMLVGATASAEERTLGTAEWQILQPWAYWKPWTVKVMIVCVLTLILGLALPIVLEAAFPLIGDTGHAGLRRLYTVISYWGPADYGPLAVLLIALFSFYVSTLCAGGLRALLLTLPLAFGFAQLYAYLHYAAYRVERSLLIERYGAAAFDYNKGGPWFRHLATYSPADVGISFRVEWWLSLIALAGFVLLILVLAIRNSRSAERGMTFARSQLPWVLTYVLLAGVLGQAIPAYLQWWLFTH